MIFILKTNTEVFILSLVYRGYVLELRRQLTEILVVILGSLTVTTSLLLIFVLTIKSCDCLFSFDKLFSVVNRPQYLVVP